MPSAGILPFNFIELPSSSGHYLLTNPCGSFAYMSGRRSLEQLINQDLSRFPSQQIDELISKNFITTDSDRADRLSRMASVFASRMRMGLESPSLFMIVPTLRCDHDCGYCQVSRVPAGKSGYDLEVESIDRILQIIDRVSHGPIKIEFQGGEPLLAFDYVRRFVERATDLPSHRNLSFVICSALGPLNRSMLDWCGDHDIFFSVSLDGPEHVHNANRPSRYFTPYDVVVKNIAQIRAVLGHDQVSCLSTITRYSLEYPNAIADTYFNLELEGIYLRPLSPYGFASSNRRIGYSAPQYFDFYRQALDRVFELNEERRFIEETALFHWKRIFRPNDMGFVDLKSPSGHVFGGMVFNYDGQVFGSDEARMLWESTRSSALPLGDINDEPEQLMLKPENVALLSQTFTCAMPGCVDCAYQPYCGADPLYHLATRGEPVGHKADSFFCQLERELFGHFFTLLSSDDAKSRILDSWLTH